MSQSELNGVERRSLRDALGRERRVIFAGMQTANVWREGSNFEEMLRSLGLALESGKKFLQIAALLECDNEFHEQQCLCRRQIARWTVTELAPAPVPT